MALAAAVTCAAAAEAPLWLRHNAISPDGTRIAFTYRGDIYIVPVGGGRAEQLTSHAGHDTDPVWSPDSLRTVWGEWMYSSWMPEAASRGV